MANAQRAVGKKVMLMATCLCDSFFDEAAKATVLALEHAGCEVLFPDDQTCCGQPAFNSGDFSSGRKVARHLARVFEGDLPVIVPSGSCAAMILHGNALQFENSSDVPEVEALAARTWELADYLVNGLKVEEWPGQLEAKIALHHSCHTRGSDTGSAMKQLLGSIQDLQLIEVGQEEQCCGFGGTFSVTFPNISSGMGQLKCEHLREGSPDWIVSADMSCLMHLSGLAARHDGELLPIRHFAEILMASLESSPSPSK